MPLFSKEERNEMKKSVVLRDFVMEQTFDLVTYFYSDQLLTLTVNPHDVVNIMNCDYERADEILGKIRRKVRKKWADPIRMSEFCDYMDIDEMLIQLFLASLSTFHPLPPIKRIDAEIACTRLRTLDELSKELQQGILPSEEVYRLRLQLWDEQNPMGEPMFKRDGFYRVLIRSHEIAQIYSCNIDTARAMLKATLKEAGFPKSRYVSIKKFCEINHVPEEGIRKALARIHGDEEEDH
jgi:hypothetical protein